MDKVELKKRLAKVQSRIVANSKDAHFAGELVTELLSLKGQLETEPTLVHIPVDEKAKIFKGDTFEMISDSLGCAFHLYGGYTIHARRNDMNEDFCSLIDDYILNQDVYNKLTGEEKEQFDTVLRLFALVLRTPILCAQNIDLLSEIGMLILKYIKKVQDESLNTLLQDEDVNDINELENIINTFSKEDEKQ